MAVIHVGYCTLVGAVCVGRCSLCWSVCDTVVCLLSSKSGRDGQTNDLTLGN